MVFRFKIISAFSQFVYSQLVYNQLVYNQLVYNQKVESTITANWLKAEIISNLKTITCQYLWLIKLFCSEYSYGNEVNLQMLHY